MKLLEDLLKNQEISYLLKYFLHSNFDFDYLKGGVADFEVGLRF